MLTALQIIELVKKIEKKGGISYKENQIWMGSTIKVFDFGWESSNKILERMNKCLAKN